MVSLAQLGEKGEAQLDVQLVLAPEFISQLLRKVQPHRVSGTCDGVARNSRKSTSAFSCCGVSSCSCAIASHGVSIRFLLRIPVDSYVSNWSSADTNPKHKCHMRLAMRNRSRVLATTPPISYINLAYFWPATWDVWPACWSITACNRRPTDCSPSPAPSSSMPS